MMPKTYNDEQITVDEFVELIELTKKKYLENPDGGKVDVETLCNDCITAVKEVTDQLDYTTKLAAALVCLMTDMESKTLCEGMKKVTGGCEWCAENCNGGQYPNRKCVVEYARKVVNEVDGYQK